LTKTALRPLGHAPSAYANARWWAWDAWQLRACHPTAHRRFVRESGKFLEGRDMASPHAIAPHDCNSHLNEGVRGFLEMETRVMLSVIDIDDGPR
jgi:hypothetical protein